MNNLQTPVLKSNGLLSPDALWQCFATGPGLMAVISGADHKVLFVNELFEQWLGYTNEDLEGAGLFFDDLLDEYLHDRLQFQLDQSRRDPLAGTRYVIYQLKGRNGRKSTFYLYTSMVTAEDGSSLYSIVMHPDLSRWDMPFTSFNSRELFLQQFDSENFGTFEWLIDADKVFWSAGVYGIYEVDDVSMPVTREFVQRLTHPDDKARIKDAIKHTITGDADLDLEYKIITEKQHVRVIHSLARAIRDTEGRPIKLVGSIRDVTEQRNIEEDLKKKVEELNHSNRELEEFAFVASHDMQEPLRKITTFSDRLSEKYKDVLAGDGLMYLSRMVASAENMRLLINNLLDFSKIAKTKQPFELVNLNHILKQVRTDLELIIEETGTIIDSHSLPKVDAIPSQMKQLFVNLISNAIKFRKPDVKPVITIENHLLVEEERQRFELPKGLVYYKITVTDNGIGFEDEYSTRIFQVFQRLHGKSEYPGSGIGLAICKKILEYHHGVIFAENVPGVGARFVFILPEHQEKPKEINT